MNYFITIIAMIIRHTLSLDQESALCDLAKKIIQPYVSSNNFFHLFIADPVELTLREMLLHGLLVILPHRAVG